MKQLTLRDSATGQTEVVPGSYVLPPPKRKSKEWIMACYSCGWRGKYDETVRAEDGSLCCPDCGLSGYLYTSDEVTREV
ncbi:MAG TPA: hypothetical protein VMB46_03525 [Methanomassiliicoccales archaeon]|nr:hypothetical protein [Methanomassiliicoccales archaeon]